MDNQPDQRFGSEFSRSFNIGMIFVSGWAMLVTMPLRRNMGNRYIGNRLLMALFAPCLYCIGMKDEFAMWVLPYGIIAVFHQSVVSFANRREYHTQYSGIPHVAMRLVRNCSEHQAKQIVEPCIVALIGVLLCGFNPYLGGFWLIGAWAAGMTVVMSDVQTRQENNQMRDAIIESRQFAASARGYRRPLRNR